MNSYKVSVVIPLYNSEKTILRALDSVINQTYKCDIEIIIVDDGSSDNGRAIVENYIDNNVTNIKMLIVQKANGGASSARNVGLKMASGEWIALLDSDDEWLPNKLYRQFEEIQKYPDMDFIATTRNGERINSILWKRLTNLSRISVKNLLIRFVFVVPTVLFKRSILEEVGYFDERLKYAEEGNYFIRIASKFNCYLLNESLVITGGGKAHFGESGLSGNIKEMEKGELRNIRYAYESKLINLIEYLFVVTFSLLKYFRRVLIVKFLR
ncbi:glycosyltransferase family 2 protein [Niabella sp. CJ426]|uniref:glycosyltransferase family 2 protein n=1 Tax=Niabella sp. CJ426 TaxID=3393740 RepID=UPI003CFE73DD